MTLIKSMFWLLVSQAFLMELMTSLLRMHLQPTEMWLRVSSS